MAQTQSQQAYGLTTGSTPTNFNWIDTRDPTTTDTNYPIGTFWQNTAVPKLWYLNSKSMVSGVLTAIWELISVASVLASLSDTANTPVFPSLPSATPPDNIQLVGGTGISVVSTPASNLITISNTGAGSDFTTDIGGPVSGGTIAVTNAGILNTGNLANALRSNGTGASTLAYQTQYAGANPAVSTALNFGVSQFDSNHFTVTSGFVAIKNGGTTGAVTEIGSDDGLYTLPAIANGAIGVIGTIIQNGTKSKPLFTTANGASIVGFNLQTTTTSTSAAKSINKSGVASFNSTAFTADIATGFVGLLNDQGGGAVTQMGTDDSGVTIPVLGSIHLLGITVPNATYNSGQALYTTAAGSNVIDLNIQTATTSTAAAKSAKKSGVCHFDSTNFTVDTTTGFVQLAGGATAAIQTITGNDLVAISGSGTPTNVNIIGTGSITTSGSGSTETIALTGLTKYNVLVGDGNATIVKVAPSATSGIPLISQGVASYPAFGTAVVEGGGTGNTTFTPYSVITAGTTATGAFQNVSGVGTSGQVLTSNGAAALPTWQSVGVNNLQITLEAGTTPISPTADVLNFKCAQVTTGTTTNGLRCFGSAANEMTIQVQHSTTSASSNANLNGISHFSSTQFNVDSNGFVTFIGSTSNIPWTDEGAPWSISSNSGYFVTAATTGTLPATPAQGDVVRIISDIAGVVTIQANTGQKIRIGNVISSTAGTVVSTRIGDSMNLVYRSSDGTWYAMDFNGTWGAT